VIQAVEKAAPGASVRVDLSAGLVTIEGDAPVEAVRAAVEAAGFEYLGPVG